MCIANGRALVKSSAPYEEEWAIWDGGHVPRSSQNAIFAERLSQPISFVDRGLLINLELRLEINIGTIKQGRTVFQIEDNSIGEK